MIKRNTYQPLCDLWRFEHLNCSVFGVLQYWQLFLEKQKKFEKRSLNTQKLCLRLIVDNMKNIVVVRVRQKGTSTKSHELRKWLWQQRSLFRSCHWRIWRLISVLEHLLHTNQMIRTKKTSNKDWQCKKKEPQDILDIDRSLDRIAFVIYEGQLPIPERSIVVELSSIWICFERERIFCLNSLQEIPYPHFFFTGSFQIIKSIVCLYFEDMRSNLNKQVSIIHLDTNTNTHNNIHLCIHC
jgi:hypothetical protein